MENMIDSGSTQLHSFLYDKAVAYGLLLLDHAHTLFHYLIDPRSEATISCACRRKADASVCFKLSIRGYMAKKAAFLSYPGVPTTL